MAVFSLGMEAGLVMNPPRMDVLGDSIATYV